MIRKDLRAAIEMNRLETFTAHSLAGLLAASNEEQAKRHRQNASTLLYELAQRGEIVCVGHEGLHKVYRKAKTVAPLLSPKAKPEPTTKRKDLPAFKSIPIPEPEPTTDPRTADLSAAREARAHTPELTDVQLGRAMINLVAQLERTIVGLNSRITALAKEKQLLAAEHHRQLDLKEQALRAAQDKIKQLEHKLQQATLIRRPGNGGAPLTMAIGKLLDSAGAGL